MNKPTQPNAANGQAPAADAAAIADQLRSARGDRAYTWVPEAARSLQGTGTADSETLREVLKILLDNFALQDAPLSIPASVAALYDRELERIRSLDSAPAESLGFGRDERQKDLAILTFRLIPVGAEFAEPRSAIWTRRVLTARATQFPRAARFFLLNGHGFSPYFQLHMHQESHDDFNSEGWMQTYCRLAELLECNPDHKGWFSCSWLIDPALEHISPHLSYLRTVPEENGGAIFYMEDDPEGKTGALATSRTRRRLFESGDYRPRIYLRVWPARQAIRWWRSNARHQ